MFFIIFVLLLLGIVNGGVYIGSRYNHPNLGGFIGSGIVIALLLAVLFLFTFRF